MNRASPALLVVLSLSLVACGGPDDDDGNHDGSSFKISTETLSGTIAGQPWTFVQGGTDAFLSDGDDFFSKLFASAYTSCDAFDEPKDAPFMILDVPTTVGEHPFGNLQNATFVPAPGENLVGTFGGINVTEVTATTVTAGVRTSFDDDNWANGYFTVDICP